MTRSTRSALFLRSLRKNYPIAVKGEGVWVHAADGKRYLDFAGSAVVNFIGHGDQEIVKGIAKQGSELEFVHSSQFTTAAAEEFAAEILEFAGPAFEGGAVFFTSGGSEAVESALKLARQYQVEIGQSQRTRLLSRKQAYHGATFGAMAVSGNRKRREIYLPMFTSYAEVNTPYCYRCEYGCVDCAGKYASEVERVVEDRGESIAAFILEPVSGATLGAVAPPDGYLQEVARHCRVHGVLLIADEVMTGFGRTGKNFAVDHWGVQPDIIVAAKGISSGYAPLGAVIASRQVVDAIANGSGALVHGFTYNAHPISVAAGRAVLQKIKSNRLVDAANSNQRGSRGSVLKVALQRLAELPFVGDVRGVGMMWGVEFVKDKKTKEPFPAEFQFAPAVGAAAMKRGVAVYPMQGCVDGIAGDHILVAPPAIINDEEIAFGIERLQLAIEEVGTNSLKGVEKG
jgi:adenosylmethionine-8-amino-7-oxononanoate aminotransferase